MFKKVDPTTLLYGIGASIVLLGAMFKFVGWPFANQLFITGLGIEAVIFFISAFEPKQKEDSYKWEQVFPQLTRESGFGKGDVDANAFLKDALMQYVDRIKYLEKELEVFNAQLFSGSANYSDLGEALKLQGELIKELNEKLAKLNQQFGSLQFK